MSRRSKTKTVRNRGVAPGDSWAAAACCLWLAAVSWFVFGQARSFQFVNFDDPTYVLENPIVARGFSFNGIGWAFTHVQGANWHPLTWLSHMLDAQLYGANPAGHHLTSVVLHIITAILLFLTLKNFTGALYRSAFVATIFAIHPLRVESVAWVAERKDVLSGLFFVLVIAAYGRYARRPWSVARYGVVIVLFALGLMCKPMLVTLPVVLLLLDSWPLGRFTTADNSARGYFQVSRRLILEKLPFLALSAVSTGITLFAQRGALQTFTGIPIPLRLANAFAAYGAYVRQMLWPSDLAVLYPFSDRDLVLYGILSFVFLAAISTAVFLFRRRRYLVTGWLWYLLMLLPVIGIIQVGNQARADRYTYLPQIGLYLMLTWLVADLCARLPHRRVLLCALAIGIICPLILAARVQASFWTNSEALWTRAIAVTSENAIAHTNLAEAFFKKGKPDEVIEHARKALQIDPGQAVAESALGLVYLQKRQLNEAALHLQKAAEIEPNTALYHTNLAVALTQLGRITEAVAHYNRALDIDPNNIEAQNNLAWILATWPDPAVRDGKRALELAERANVATENRNATICVTLAASYAEAGRFEEAVTMARHASNLAAAQGRTAKVNYIEGQIRLYENHSAFRDQPAPASSP